MTDKVLISILNIYTAHTAQLQKKKKANPVKKWEKDLNSHFFKEDSQVATDMWGKKMLSSY